MFSDEVRLLGRPFAVYRELRQNDDATPLRTIAARFARTQLILAVTVAFITAGRLPARLIAGTFVFWGMVPVIQTLMMLGGQLVAGRPRDIRPARALGLHLVGNTPMLAWMILGAALCVFAPNTYAAFSFALKPVLAPTLVIAFFYGSFLSYAFYRAVLERSRGRAIFATLVEFVLKVGIVVAWYMAIDNIVPQLSGAH